MERTQISLRSLKSVKVLFEGDVYDLGCFLLKAYKAQDQRTGSRSRPTVHGLASGYSVLTRVSRDAIIEVFNRHGLPLGATVEPDEDQCLTRRCKRGSEGEHTGALKSLGRDLRRDYGICQVSAARGIGSDLMGSVLNKLACDR